MGHRMRIAVLLGGIVYEVQRRLLEGIMECGRKRGVGIFVFTCNGDGYRQSEYGVGEFNIFRLPKLTDYDGIVLVRETIQSERVAREVTELARCSGVPAVSIETRVEGMPCFYIDNCKAMEQVIAHLADCHLQAGDRVCCLSGPRQNRESTERLESVIRSLNVRGFQLCEEDIFYGDFWVESGRMVVRTLVEQKKKLPRAVICANDDMALGVCLELREQGIQPGGEVMVTGFDHTSDSDRLFPAIATVEKPLFKMGYEACDCLLDGGAADREFEAKYFLRGSCGCPETDKQSVQALQVEELERRLESMSMAEINKNMASDLNDHDNLGGFCSCLKKYVESMAFTHFYLCLCEEKPENGMEYSYVVHEEYAERIHIPLAWENGVFREYGYYPRRLLLPENCLKNSGGTYFVMPLHFRKNCLGYCVAAGNEIPMTSTQFQNWMMNISNSLENIRKQCALKRLVSRLDDMAFMDTMTGVFNRAGFFRFAAKIEEECRQENCGLELFFLDINRLKHVNDEYGHEEGDFYIKAVAGALKKLKRSGQIIMRYGGDEFAVLGKKRRGTPLEDFGAELGRILTDCRKQAKKPYDMSVSVGRYNQSVGADFRLDRLIEQADKEMYKRKKEWRTGREQSLNRIDRGNDSRYS